jgi:3-hydroxybutyryl-CoA dehydrogenase
VANEISRIGVVGAGLMGSGIAEVCARAGLDVKVSEVNPDALDAGQGRITNSLNRGVRNGKLSEADRDAALSRLRFTTDLGDFADREMVVEAVAENEQTKLEVFGTLDKVVTDPEAILASNTSSIPIMKLGVVTSRPTQVIGIHFFNPVPVLQLVEVIRGLETSDETARAISELAAELGKTPAEARDFPGFVSNRILMPFINEAAYALMEGVAEPEAIDTIAKLGFAHPMGPLALADLIGLDTCVAIMEVLRDGLGDDRYEPCPLLRDLVVAGKLGRKSGAGFYIY